VALGGNDGAGYKRRGGLVMFVDQKLYAGMAEMLDALPERVVRYRVADLTIVYCNAAWASAYKITPERAVGRTLKEFLSKDGLEGLAAQLARLGPDDPILVDPVFRTDLDAPGRFAQWVDRFVSDDDGDAIVAVGRDVTERHVAELKLAESEARFRDLAEKSVDVVWHFVLDPVPHLDYVSPSVERSLGYPPSFFLGDFDVFLGILDDEGRSAVDRALLGERIPERYDFKFRHHDGSIVIGETITSVVRGGLQGVSRDVTELRRLQAGLATQALRDPLTGLANRRLFNELFDSDLARTQRNGLPLAVAFLDLDDFKNVNDSYGHDAGDVVLCETARRLQSVVRTADVVARLGGDEFVVVYEPSFTTSDDLVRRISDALSAPIQVTTSASTSCSASIGTADTRTVGYSAAALLAAADAAMYEVKRAYQRRRALPITNLSALVEVASRAL
jgi:diguanylate cyclase (GGDEF)-like protein/PAS domain S-box-containing protein